MTVDPELGLAYLPVESPTSDYYGGERPGNNLYGESLVCVELKTGKMKWYFQIVHHPVWDYDMSSAPLLADVIVDGKPRQGGRGAQQGIVPVCVRSRDRASRSGRSKNGPCRRPMCPAKRPRRRSRSRPSRRLTGATTSRFPDDLIDFTPEMRADAHRSDEELSRGRHVHASGDRRSEGTGWAESTWATRAAAPTGPAPATIPNRTPCSRRRRRRS